MTAAAQKAIQAATEEERRLKKMAKKAQFDAGYDGDPDAADADEKQEPEKKIKVGRHISEFGMRTLSNTCS